MVTASKIRAAFTRLSSAAKLSKIFACVYKCRKKSERMAQPNNRCPCALRRGSTKVCQQECPYASCVEIPTHIVAKSKYTRHFHIVIGDETIQNIWLASTIQESNNVKRWTLSLALQRIDSESVRCAPAPRS